MSDELHDRLGRIEGILADRGCPPLTEAQRQRYLERGTFCPQAIASLGQAVEVFREEKRDKQRKRTRRRTR